MLLLIQLPDKGYTEIAPGLIRFIPSSDSGVVASSGNTISPQIATIFDLYATPDNYESELIALKKVAFIVGDGVAPIVAEQNYYLTDGTILLKILQTSQVLIIVMNLFLQNYLP